MDSNINIIQIVSSAIVIIGIPIIIGELIYIGRKIQVLDDIVIALEKISYNLKVIADFLVKNATDFNSPESYNSTHPEITE